MKHWKLALLLIVLIAVGLRLVRTSFGLPYLHHWDEPQVAATSLQMMKTGDFNPHFFNYGSLMLYAHLAVDTVCFVHLMRRDPLPFPITHGPSGQKQIDLSALQTRYDTGRHWEVSHPDFFLWNRGLTALLGAATVFLAFFFGRAIDGPETGIVGAALLAVQGLHVEHSAYVTTDVPMALAAFAAVYFSVLFVQDGRKRDLYASLVAAGFAASIKYNAVVCWAIPFWAIWKRRDALPKRPLPLFLLPPLAFLLTTPYAVLDLPAFLSQAGYEIHHYAVEGHEAIERSTAWYATWQLKRLAENLGLLAGLAALVGVALLLRRRSGRLVLLYPALAFLLVATSRVPVQRNLLTIYPFLALAGGYALVCGLRALPGRGKTLGVAAFAFWFGAIAWAQADESLRLGRNTETRSRAVDAVLEAAERLQQEEIRVGVADELRLHGDDLRRLESDPRIRSAIAPHLDLVCDASSWDLLVVGVDHAGIWPHRRDAKDLARKLNHAVLDAEHVEISDPDGSPLRLDGLSKNPRVRIYLNPDASSPECAP